jgi:hypothetical protein
LDLSRSLGSIMGGDLEAGSYLRNQAAKAGVSDSEIAMQRQRIQGKGVDADHAAIIAAIGAKAGYDARSATVLSEILAEGTAGMAPVSTGMIPNQEDIYRANSMLNEARGTALEVGGKTATSEQVATNAGMGARAVQGQAQGAGGQAWKSSPGMYKGVPSANMRPGDARDVRVQAMHAENAGNHQQLLKDAHEESRLNLWEGNRDFDEKLMQQAGNLYDAAPYVLSGAAFLGAAPAAVEALGAVVDAFRPSGVPTTGGQGVPTSPTSSTSAPSSGGAGTAAPNQQSPQAPQAPKGSRAAKDAEVAKDLASRALDIAKKGGVVLRSASPVTLAAMTAGAANMTDEQWERVFSAYDKGDYARALGAFIEESSSAGLGKVEAWVAEAVDSWNAGAQASTSWALDRNQDSPAQELPQGSGQLVHRHMNPKGYLASSEMSEGQPVVQTQTPVQGQAVVQTQTPVQGQAVVQTQMPVQGQAVVQTQTPVQGQAVVQTQMPEGQPVVQTQMPVQGQAVVQTQMPEGQPVVQTQMPVQGQPVVQTQMPVQGQAVVQTQMPVQGQAVVQTQTPVSPAQELPQGSWSRSS